MHRICFIISRALAILGVPVAVLFVGGDINDSGITVIWFLKLMGAIFLALLPIITFKLIIRARCPACGEKLNREIVGAGNYDCESCGASYS